MYAYYYFSTLYTLRAQNPISVSVQDETGINAAFVIYATYLPSVREKTGSAELRISNETQFAIIWKEQKCRDY